MTEQDLATAAIGGFASGLVAGRAAALELDPAVPPSDAQFEAVWAHGYELGRQTANDYAGSASARTGPVLTPDNIDEPGGPVEPGLAGLF